MAAVGPGVTGWQLGARVGVQPLWWSCGHCEYCWTAREELCRCKQITGDTVDGGYAEYLLARAEHAYPVPEALDLAAAAPLFCPGITAYHAIKQGQEMLEVLALVAAGKVRAIVEPFPLDQAGDALRLLEQGKIPARAVLVL